MDGTDPTDRQFQEAHAARHESTDNTVLLRSIDDKNPLICEPSIMKSYGQCQKL
jgi:hypothetical protein